MRLQCSLFFCYHQVLYFECVDTTFQINHAAYLQTMASVAGHFATTAQSLGKVNNISKPQADQVLRVLLCTAMGGSPADRANSCVRQTAGRAISCVPPSKGATPCTCVTIRQVGAQAAYVDAGMITRNEWARVRT